MSNSVESRVSITGQLTTHISSLSVSERDPEEIEDNEQVAQEKSKYQLDKEDQRSLSQTPSVGCQSSQFQARIKPTALYQH